MNSMHTEEFYKDNNRYTEFLEQQATEDFAKYARMATEYIESGDAILDVGCGTGLALLKMQDYSNNLWGVDISGPSIRMALSRNLNVLKYDGGGLPFPDESFRVCGSFNVLEHTDDPIYFLDEQLRVLDKGGYLIIACPNFLSISNNYHWHTRGYTRKVRNLFQLFKKLLMSSKFEKMQTIVREPLQVDDDACNVTNPVDIFLWGRSRKLKLIYWSSQLADRNGILKWLDAGPLRIFLGACFLVFKK